MTDIIDRAAEIEQMERDDALARSRREAIDPASWNERSAKWCEGDACGVRIPDARRRAVPGVKLCAECAEREERLSKTRRRL